MKTAVKLGGSLSKDRNSLLALCQTIGKLGLNHHILLIPGGGHYADTVRKDDDLYHLPDTISHQMAVLAMSQYGYLLHHLIEESRLLHRLEDFQKTGTNGVYIWLPHADLVSMKNLPTTWQFTSDSIAAYATHYLHLKRLILLKSVDGIPSNVVNPCVKTRIIRHMKAHELRGCDIVDYLFSDYLQDTGCWVINGLLPQRLEELLVTGHTYGTAIS